MEIREGATLSVRHTVTEKDTASAHRSGGLEVYATPAMVALMEESAYMLLKKCGAESVGTELKIRHTRACLCGTEVEACAKVIATDGKKVIFEVSATDKNGIIGEGEHTRYVIDPEKFMSKLNGN